MGDDKAWLTMKLTELDSGPDEILSRLGQSIDCAIIRVRNNTIEWVSPSLYDTLGCRPQEWIGQSPGDVLSEGPAAPVDRFSLDPSTGPLSVRRQFRAEDGTVHWVRVRAGVCRDPSGNADGIIAVLTVIDDEMSAEGALTSQLEKYRAIAANMTQAQRATRTALERFQAIMSSSPIGMALATQQRQFVAVNAAMCSLLGRDESWLLEHSLTDVLVEEDKPAICQQGDALIGRGSGRVSGDVRVVTGSGELRWVRRTGTLVPSDIDGEVFLLLQVEDITEQRQIQEQLTYQAFHDPLTGLYNRSWILDTLDRELEAARRGRQSVAVMFIDLDFFKVINDSLGHPIGDSLLCKIGSRIVSSIRAHDYAARIGGDEFMIVATDITEHDEVEALVNRIMSTIKRPVSIPEHHLRVSASIGLALSDDESTSASLLRSADSAMYQAKANGRGTWQYYDKSMHEAAVRRLTTEGDLRTAIEEHQFVVHYQPIVSLDRLEIEGYEALVRWEHPIRGLLHPDQFLTIAEDTALIVDIGDEVLDQVCHLLADHPEIRGSFSVNNSPMQISHSDWYPRLQAVLNRYRVDASRLNIEVTESAILTHTTSLASDLRELRGLGVGLHIDDFGTGYSSLTLLRDLPVTGIKLDRSFTERITDDNSARVLAAGICHLASDLDLECIAEGIEESGQAQILHEQGWQAGQGYLYGRPERSPVLSINSRAR